MPNVAHPPPDLVPPPRAPRTWRDWRGWPRRRTLLRLLPWALGVVFLAGIAIPNLFFARVNWNDTSAWFTLRTIADAQQLFRDNAAVDLDGDRRGEFGSFLELSGAAPLRGRDDELCPAVLSGAFRTLNASGAVRRSGYLFRIYLRAADGVWVPADPPPNDLDADAAETAFLCYAWPAQYGRSGRPTMVVDQTGTVLRTDDPRYSGPLAPEPDAAPGVGTALVAGQGNDGNEWVAEHPRH